jgi:hypothetical protein
MASATRASICQRAVGENPLPGYGPVDSVNRPVRTRMRGGVGAGGEKPPATRLTDRFFAALSEALEDVNATIRRGRNGQDS